MIYDCLDLPLGQFTLQRRASACDDLLMTINDAQSTYSCMQRLYPSRFLSHCCIKSSYPVDSVIVLLFAYADRVRATSGGKISTIDFNVASSTPHQIASRSRADMSAFVFRELDCWSSSYARPEPLRQQRLLKSAVSEERLGVHIHRSCGALDRQVSNSMLYRPRGQGLGHKAPRELKIKIFVSVRRSWS